MRLYKNEDYDCARFIALRKFVDGYTDLANQVKELRQVTGNHSEQLNRIYDTLEKLLNEKENGKDTSNKWQEREMIGFIR